MENQVSQEKLVLVAVKEVKEQLDVEELSVLMDQLVQEAPMEQPEPKVILVHQDPWVKVVHEDEMEKQENQEQAVTVENKETKDQEDKLEQPVNQD
jgi:DNA integrity scanning protein DisA with diadenylate cyclase activity